MSYKQYDDGQEEAFNQFMLSPTEQDNFKKMIGKYTDMDQLARGIGLLKNNTMKCFDYTERVENSGGKFERTIRTPKQHVVRNWKNMMNKYGWGWVNENVYLMACNDIIFPTTIIDTLMKNYGFEFQKRPIVTIIPEETRTAMNNLF